MLESLNIELSGTKIAGFQSKAIATKSSILDVSGIPDLPQIRIFGKVSFNRHAIEFNRDLSYLCGNHVIISYTLDLYSC